MFLGIEPGVRVELELDAFPKTCFCKDTLNIGGYERALRGERTSDELYASAMEAIAIGDDAEQQGKLFRLAKRLFRVDTHVHLRASQQVLLAQPAPPSALAMRFSDLEIVIDNDGRCAYAPFPLCAFRVSACPFYPPSSISPSPEDRSALVHSDVLSAARPLSPLPSPMSSSLSLSRSAVSVTHGLACVTDLARVRMLLTTAAARCPPPTSALCQVSYSLDSVFLPCPFGLQF